MPALPTPHPSTAQLAHPLAQQLLHTNASFVQGCCHQGSAASEELGAADHNDQQLQVQRRGGASEGWVGGQAWQWMHWMQPAQVPPSPPCGQSQLRVGTAASTLLSPACPPQPAPGRHADLERQADGSCDVAR